VYPRSPVSTLSSWMRVVSFYSERLIKAIINFYDCLFIERYQRTGVVPGMAIEMNCSSNCRLDNRLEVTWLFWQSPGGKAHPVDVSSSTYAQTTNGGLVIMRVSAVEHIGTYQCTHNGTVLTEHKLTASGE